MQINLLGYTPKLFKKKHTNYWPWQYLAKTFQSLGLSARMIEAEQVNHRIPQVYICWNKPDSLTLIEKFSPHKDSIIIQKLTSFDESPESKRDWTDNPMKFFKEWHWPQHAKLDALKETGYRYYGFGAKTVIDDFPVKKEIVDRHKDRIFWIPWGTMTVPYDQIMESQPILDGFEHDIGFVGSRWGTAYRGNILEWDSYLAPLIKQHNAYIAGKGTKVGVVNVEKHLEIIRASKLCPIIHAASWKTEKGIMDRFWTVFSLGRFGVCDNEGILDFYDEKEVVLALSPEEYLDKSNYYLNHVDKQKPYIEAALNRIKKEYNQREVWKKIWRQVIFE